MTLRLCLRLALPLLMLCLAPMPALRADAPHAPSPIPPTPRKYWQVQAFLFAAQGPDSFGLRLEKDTRAAFTFTPQKNLTATMTDSAGRILPADIVSLPQAPRVPVFDNPRRRPDPPERGVQWLGFQWRTAGLAPDLYTLKVSVPVQAADTATGGAITLPPAQASLTIYLPPAPDREPSLAPKQQFLCLPGDEEPLPYTDAQGQEPPREALVLKVWTLAHVTETGAQRQAGQRRLTFTVAGRPGTLSLTTNADVSALPGLVPLVEDSTLRRLRAKYEGRAVWGYGGIGAQFPPVPGGGMDGLSADGSRPVILARLVRLALPNATLAMGGQIGAMGGDRQSEFITRNPLLAVLELPRALHITGASGSGRSSERATQNVMGAHFPARTGYEECADAWDFERQYSLAPWQKQHPEWPRAMRKAVQNGELHKGMTPEMAAWVSGFPAEYGTKAQLLAWAKAPKAAWRYDNLPPFNFWIYFHGGHVVSSGTDGSLP